MDIKLRFARFKEKYGKISQVLVENLIIFLQNWHISVVVNSPQILQYLYSNFSLPFFSLTKFLRTFILKLGIFLSISYTISFHFAVGAYGQLSWRKGKFLAITYRRFSLSLIGHLNVTQGVTLCHVNFTIFRPSES